MLGGKTAYQGAVGVGKNKCKGREGGKHKGFIKAFPGLEPPYNFRDCKDAEQHFPSGIGGKKDRQELHKAFNLDNRRRESLCQGAEAGRWPDKSEREMKR